MLLRALPWLALYLCAGFSCLVESGALGRAVAPDLARLPSRLGTLEVLEELPVDPAAFGKQPPERTTFRRVRDAHGREGRLFVAYYERAQRWSGRPHDLEKCYAAQGWQEREAHRLEHAHRLWSRLFARAGEGEAEDDAKAIRVLHWLELPGPDRDRLDWRELRSRVASGRGFRQDVASVYLEFPADAAPDERELVTAVSALSAALEGLW
jgi:hypothetical protein